MQQYTTLRPQSEKGLGHLATWSPVCGVGLGSRLLDPPYLQNELRNWGPLSFQVMQDRHHPDWPRPLPLLVHMWFFWKSPSFLWWCFREHEEDSCPFLSVHSAGCGFDRGVAASFSHHTCLHKEGRRLLCIPGELSFPHIKPLLSMAFTPWIRKSG